MSQEELYQWMSEILKHLSSLGKWQAYSVAMYSLGVMWAQNSSVYQVSKWLWQFGERSSVEKRLKRYLSNERIALEAIQMEWVKWVSQFFSLEELVILVDETKLSIHLNVMVVGLAYRQRCIPLVWACYRGALGEGRMRMIVTLLQVVKASLPEQARPLVEMDRGLGTSPRLLREIDKLNWRYLVRVQGMTRLRTFRGKQHRLRDLVKRGESWSGMGYVFKKNGSIRAYVHVLWDWDQKDMWCLVTNDKALSARAYALRNWQEQSFRDLKSGGFHWQRSQVFEPRHAERLLLVLTLAYARLLAFGSSFTPDLSEVYVRVSRRTRPARSLFSAGLRYWWDCLVNHIPAFPGLFFAPDKALLKLIC